MNLLSHFPWSRVWPELDCKGSSCTRCKETRVATNLFVLDGLGSHFTHTILSCQIYVKADEINLLHWISCFERSCVLCWCDLILLELWQKWDLSQGPRCGSSHCVSCSGAGGAHLGEGTWCQGSHGNSCGAEDPDITGSVAQEQAAKPLGPRFSFGTKPGFLNPNILH